MVDLAWPNDLGAGTAVWQLFRMGADNWDEDRDPQLKAAHETIVEFVPDVTQVVRYEGDMGKASIEPMISRGIINEQGQLCTMNEDGTAGPVGVVLPATNSDTITPKNWTYRATITKNRVRVREFSFPAPAGEDVDLADYIEIEASGGTHIITEIETAERAEKARDKTLEYRNETRTFRNEAQTARTGAETAATTAGEVLEATQALGITVDNSVGTKVSIGDQTIFYDSGSRRMTQEADGLTGGNIYLRRQNSIVEVTLQDVRSVAQENSWWELTGFMPEGFRPVSTAYFPLVARNSTYSEEPFRVDNNGNTFVYGFRDAEAIASVVATYTTPDDFPATLPGEPA